MGCICYLLSPSIYISFALRCFERVDDGRVISLVPAGIFCILDSGV